MSFIVIEAKKTAFEKFLKCCFKDIEYRYNYGYIHEDLPTILEYAKNKFPNVKRILVTNNCGKVIGFSNIILEENFAEIQGGINPDLIDCMYGAYATLSVIEYTFLYLSTSTIRIRIFSHNTRSFKLMTAIGFVFTEKFNILNHVVNVLELHKTNFPNDFCKKLLIRKK